MPKNKFKVLLITCWVLLGLCLISKMFGANIFTTSAKKENFIKFCDCVDNHLFLRYGIINLTINIISSSLYYMAIFQEPKFSKRALLWFIPLIIYAIIKSIFYNAKVVFYVLDIVMMVGLPLLIDYKRWLVIIISFGLTFVFQYISMLLKLNQYTMFDNNTIMVFILNIDYYIMFIIYWLYRLEYKNRKKQKEIEEISFSFHFYRS